MKTVFKYPLLANRRGVEMPRGARILTVMMQAGGPTVWALVDPSAEKVYRTVHIVGTGHEVPPHTVYVGSVIDGPFVWHIFDGGEA